jgi:hypothetical protein
MRRSVQEIRAVFNLRRNCRRGRASNRWTLQTSRRRVMRAINGCAQLRKKESPPKGGDQDWVFEA